MTHKFSIAGHEGYLHIGLYPNTRLPGEIFITMAKEGSTISGLMDAFATSVSIALQYGVPVEDLCNKFSHMRFEPSRLYAKQAYPDRQVDPGLHLPLSVAEVFGQAGRSWGGGGRPRWSDEPTVVPTRSRRWR